MTPSEIYWLTRCDLFIDLCEGVMIVTTVIGGLLIFIGIMARTDTSKPNPTLGKRIHRWAILPILLFLCGLAGKILIPTTKDMIAIRVIPVILQNEDVQKLPADLVKVAREWLEGLRPKQP